MIGALLLSSAIFSIAMFHLNHPAGAQADPHGPDGDHLHKLRHVLLPLSLLQLLYVHSDISFQASRPLEARLPPKPQYPQNLRSPPGFPQVCCPSCGAAPRADWGRGGVVARQIVCNPPTPVTERAQHSQALAVGAAGEGCLSCACLARDGYDQVQYYSRKCGYEQVQSFSQI